MAGALSGLCELAADSDSTVENGCSSSFIRTAHIDKHVLAFPIQMDGSHLAGGELALRVYRLAFLSVAQQLSQQSFSIFRSTLSLAHGRMCHRRACKGLAAEPSARLPTLESTSPTSDILSRPTQVAHLTPLSVRVHRRDALRRQWRAPANRSSVIVRRRAGLGGMEKVSRNLILARLGFLGESLFGPNPCGHWSEAGVSSRKLGKH